MTALHRALFGVTDEVARGSARLRVSANNTVDRITSKQSTDEEADWAALEADLRGRYRLIAAQLGHGTAEDREAGETMNAANDYHFVTHWRVPCTVEEAAAVLSRAEDLPRWWPAVYLNVEELAPGDEAWVGREVTLYTKGWLPYTLRWQFRTTESRYPHGFALEATGDFVGRGEWTLEQAGSYVDLTYDWQIRADKPLLRRLSFLLKPVFAANHYWAMAKGEESLLLELQRRRAATEEARKLVPSPPGPTPTAEQLVPIIAPLLTVPLAYVLARRLRRVANRRGTAGLCPGCQREPGVFEVEVRPKNSQDQPAHVVFAAAAGVVRHAEDLVPVDRLDDDGRFVAIQNRANRGLFGFTRNKCHDPLRSPVKFHPSRGGGKGRRYPACYNTSRTSRGELFILWRRPSSRRFRRRARTSRAGTPTSSSRPSWPTTG